MISKNKSLPVALLAVFAYLGAFFYMPVAQAGMIGTQTVLQSQSRAERIAQVRDLLSQERVVEQMIQLGVDPAAAKARVASLTNTQLARVEGELESLPAGAGLLAVLGVVFVVLMVLELVGVLNLFNNF